MAPDRTADWPRGSQLALTVAYAMAYASVFVAGVDVALGRVGGVGLEVGHVSSDVIGVLAATFSLAGLLAHGLERWRWEYYAVAALVGSLLAYNVIDWLVVLFIADDATLRGPAVASATIWLLVARGISLWAFNRRTTGARLAVVAA